MDDTLASKTHAWACKQACKDAHKPNGWHRQAWKAYHHTEQKRGKVCMKQPASRRCILTGYIQQGLMGVECNHTTTNPLKALNVAKPRTREANTSIKQRSKQA